MSIGTNSNNDARRFLRPSLSLVQALAAADHPALKVQQLRTDQMIMQALLIDVPARVMPWVHQPLHAALDSAYIETKTPPKVFLHPDNVFGFNSSSLKSFAARFAEQLSILCKADDPSYIEAPSLSDVRLGRAIVQRQPATVEFIQKLIAAEQRWIAEQLIHDAKLN